MLTAAAELQWATRSVWGQLVAARLGRVRLSTAQHAGVPKGIVGVTCSRLTLPLHRTPRLPLPLGPWPCLTKDMPELLQLLHAPTSCCMCPQATVMIDRNSKFHQLVRHAHQWQPEHTLKLHMH